MKTRILKQLCLSIILSVILINTINATMSLTEISVPSSVNHNAGVTITFNITTDTNYTSLVWSGTSSKATFTTLPTITNINSGSTQTLSTVLTINNYASGTITDAKINVIDTTTNDTDTLSFSQMTIINNPGLSVSSSTISSGKNSTTITIKNTGNKDLTGIKLTYVGDFDVSFSENNFNLIAGESNDITVTITNDLNDLDLGSNSVTITATASDNTFATGKISKEGDYCDFPNLGNNLDISLKNIDVKEGFGDNENWYAFDEIEVEIRVENNGADDIKNIEVEWGLFNKKTGKFIIDDKESDFNLKDGKDKDLTITFFLDEDIDDLDGGDFIFIAKATGEDKEFDSNDTCDSDSEPIDVIIESDFVILDRLGFTTSASCGTEISITADVWNIGDDDQNDVGVRIFNKDLKIDKRVLIGDIDAFDREKLNAVVNIPSNALEKSYTLEFWVYDEDGDDYESEDNDKSSFFKPLSVQGGCSTSNSGGDLLGAIVSANLESGGKAGEEMVVKLRITNTDSSIQTFKINAEEYSNWAELISINPEVVVLNSEQSGESIITLKVNKEASGENIFNVILTNNKGKSISQPVTVNIEKSGFSAGITGGVIGEGNWYLWGIGFLNVLLIIIIIIVAVRVVKK